MLDCMYDIPGMVNVKECIIDEKVIRDAGQPKLVYYSDEEMRAKAEVEKNKKQSESA